MPTDLLANIKLSLRVELIGLVAVRITISNIHDKLLNNFYYSNDVIYYSHKHKFSIKSERWSTFTPTSFTLPKKSIGNNVCSYVFLSTEQRYTSLKKFSKTLMDLSLSRHFEDENLHFKDNRIVYFKENWVLY